MTMSGHEIDKYIGRRQADLEVITHNLLQPKAGECLGWCVLVECSHQSLDILHVPEGPNKKYIARTGLCEPLVL